MIGLARLRWCLLAISVALFGADVTILVVGPDGQTVDGCRVGEFREMPIGAYSRERADYKDRFRGLAGDSIPVGQFEAKIFCGDWHVTQDVQIQGGDQFELVSTTSRMLRSDPVRPSLAIKLASAIPAGETWWVRFLGIYRSETYTERFSLENGEAKLIDPEPGVYIVGIHSSSGYACFTEIEFVEFSRKWVFHPDKCSFDFDRYAHLIQRTASRKPMESPWPEEMRRKREELFKALQRAADPKQ